MLDNILIFACALEFKELFLNCVPYLKVRDQSVKVSWSDFCSEFEGKYVHEQDSFRDDSYS